MEYDDPPQNIMRKSLASAWANRQNADDHKVSPRKPNARFGSLRCGPEVSFMTVLTALSPIAAFTTPIRCRTLNARLRAGFRAACAVVCVFLLTPSWGAHGGGLGPGPVVTVTFPGWVSTPGKWWCGPSVFPQEGANVSCSTSARLPCGPGSPVDLAAGRGAPGLDRSEP
jgi:hypothetical protein